MLYTGSPPPTHPPTPHPHTGLFLAWEEVKASVEGYKGALHKSFPTAQEAEEWLCEGGLAASQRSSGGSLTQGSGSASVSASASTQTRVVQPAVEGSKCRSTLASHHMLVGVSAAAALAVKMATQQVGIMRCRVEFDGGSRGNPGIAGCGALLVNPDVDQEVSGHASRHSCFGLGGRGE